MCCIIIVEIDFSDGSVETCYAARLGSQGIAPGGARMRRGRRRIRRGRRRKWLRYAFFPVAESCRVHLPTCGDRKSP